MKKNQKNTSETKVVVHTKELKPFPKEKYGSLKTKTDCTDSTPREWTKEEEAYLFDAIQSGYTRDEIAVLLDRKPQSIRMKTKRLKQNPDIDSYNEDSLLEKYGINMNFYARLGCPHSCLDLFCGTKSFWKNNTEMKVLTNDKDKRIKANYNMPAERLLAKLYSEGKRYDIVDVDCYGDPYKCIENAILVAGKGLIFTFGLKQSKRFKHQHIADSYGVLSINDLNVNSFIDYVKKRAFSLDKELEVMDIHQNSTIWRVYFSVKRRTTRKFIHKKETENSDATLKCA